MKKFVVGCAIAIAAVSVRGEYLWWGVDSDDNKSLENISAWLDEKNWTQAHLYYYEEGDFDNKELAGTVNKMSQSDPVASYDGQSIDISAFSGSSYSYYVEIVNGSTVLAYTDTKNNPIKYSDFNGSLTTTLEQIPSCTVWHGGTFKATPEPTSAMLMLIGVAGLALRRKQRKA